MEIDIIKMKILDRLNSDEEPLHLILKEIKDYGQDLKKAYKDKAVPDKKIRENLKELITNKYVRVFDEKGEEISNYDIDKVLSDDIPLWSIWFRLTELGEKAYRSNCDKFWAE